MAQKRLQAFLLILAVCGASQCAASTPAPSFTISASNVTMPSSGAVVVPFKLTSVNGFAGTLTVGCTAPAEPATVKAPFCDEGGPLLAYTLAANATTSGSFTILAIQPNPTPLTAAAIPPGRSTGSRWALTGGVLLALGLRRKAARALARRRLTVGLLAVLVSGMCVAGMCGCGGSPTLTPGVYVFTFTANAGEGSTNVSQSASTTASVTVPAGIATK